MYVIQKHVTSFNFVSKFYLDFAVAHWFSLMLCLLVCCFVDEEMSERRDRGTSSYNLQVINSVLLHHHQHHHITVMQLGHMLTRSGLT